MGEQGSSVSWASKVFFPFLFKKMWKVPQASSSTSQRNGVLVFHLSAVSFPFDDGALCSYKLQNSTIMKIEPGMAALITGAGSGLGRSLALALAERGVCLSIVEYSDATGLETLKLVEDVHTSNYLNLEKPAAIFIKCDVSNPVELASSFALHMKTFKKLDICINNAGILEEEQFTEDYSVNGSGSWRKVAAVNLLSVIDGTRLAVQSMKGYGGVILNIGSASGLYPFNHQPIYSSTKGGVVMFTRALRNLVKYKIRANVICPEFLGTELTKQLSEEFFKKFGGLIPIEKFIEASFELLEDDTKAGACLWVTNRRGAEYWPNPEEEKKYRLSSLPQRKPGSHSSLADTTATVAPLLPREFRKIVVHTLSNNFRKATEVVSVTFQPPVKPGHVLIKYLYAGVNASDVNFSAGRYFGPKKMESIGLPFDAGFEGVGIVAAVGEDISLDNVYVGSPVATMTFGAFAEFAQVPARFVLPVKAPIPEVVAILTSGLTAMIGLEQAGRMRSGETVLVTAAAGGTGQFAVQLAKLAGNKVVATCGGSEKAALLTELGADRVIDYKKEDVSSVLKKEFPNGIDLIYESVGGEMFETCLKALAQLGRLVIIGMVSKYQDDGGWKPDNYPGLCEKLLGKSQSLVGFFLPHYSKHFRDSLQKLFNMFNDGKLQVAIDPTPFNGVESVVDAVEYLHSGKSIGKVVVRLDANQSPITQQSRL